MPLTIATKQVDLGQAQERYDRDRMNEIPETKIM